MTQKGLQDTYRSRRPFLLTPSGHEKCRASFVGINTLRPRQNGRHFADDVFKCIFLNENVWISIKISLKFVPKGPINNIPAMVQIMAWRRPGDKLLSEPMMVSLPTHICVARPQWVKRARYWKKTYLVLLSAMCLLMTLQPKVIRHLRAW